MFPTINSTVIHCTDNVGREEIFSERWVFYISSISCNSVTIVPTGGSGRFVDHPPFFNFPAFATMSGIAVHMRKNWVGEWV